MSIKSQRKPRGVRVTMDLRAMAAESPFQPGPSRNSDLQRAIARTPRACLKIPAAYVRLLALADTVRP